MTRTNSFSYFPLASLAILTVTQIFFLWNHTQVQKDQTQQLASMHQELQALIRDANRKDIVVEQRGRTPPNFPDANTASKTDDIKAEIRQLVAEELQPLLATQKDLINSLANAQGKQQAAQPIVTETFDLDEEINAFEESSSIIAQSIANNRIDSESASRLHELSQFLTEESKRELRDRIVSAINNQQLVLAGDFIPPF